LSVEFKGFSFTPLDREEPILKNINLEISPGSTVGIVGRTGSGKSELLKALNGVVPKSEVGVQEGDVIINGMNTKDHGIPELATHVGIVLDNPSTQLFALTVKDDVAFGPANLGLPLDEIERRRELAMKATRLDGFENRSPNDLSGGEQQSCAIAGILAMEPRILAMDEPIAFLDPMGKQRVLSLIRDLFKKLKNTIIITESGSDIEPLAEFVDRVVVLDQGRIIMDDNPKIVFSSDLLREIGVGRPSVTELFLELRKGRKKLPIPVTLSEAVDSMKKLLEESKAGPKKAAQRRKGEKPAKRREGEPVIRVRNLEHIYPGMPPVKALQGISFDIYEGEMVGLIGQNGSGKTTLSYHLVGLLKPTNPDAEVIVDGVDTTKAPVSEIIKHINYVFQNADDQLFSETIFEEVAYGLRMQGVPATEVEGRVIDTLRLFGIEENRDNPISFLSTNLKTYTAVASTLAMGPKVLIVDEPTTGLDRTGIRVIMDVLKDMNRKGRTIIVITHSMNTIAEYCERVLVIRDGKLLIEGSVRDVFSQPEILIESSIHPPQITQLGQKLGEYGLPPDAMTVEEMAGFVEKLSKEGS